MKYLYIVASLAMTTTVLCFGSDDKMSPEMDRSAIDLRKAIWRGDTQAVREVLNRKQIDFKNRLFRRSLPLYRASKDGYPEIVELLLKAGADPNDLDLQLHPLTIAAAAIDAQSGSSRQVPMKDYFLVVKHLLDHGAKVNTVEKSGTTALLMAAEFADKDIVDLLIRAGAQQFDKHAETGETPLSLAQKKGRTDIANYLKAREASLGMASGSKAPTSLPRRPRSDAMTSQVRPLIPQKS